MAGIDHAGGPFVPSYGTVVYSRFIPRYQQYDNILVTFIYNIIFFN